MDFMLDALFIFAVLTALVISGLIYFNDLKKLLEKLNTKYGEDKKDKK